MKRTVWILPIVLLVILAPMGLAAEDLHPISQSLGFVPVLDFVKEGEGSSYYSETYQIRLTVLETEKNQQNTNLSTLELNMRSLVPHTSVTVEQNLSAQVNTRLLRFVDADNAQDMCRWVYLMDGTTKFGTVFLLGTAESFQRIEPELIAMLRSFRWLDETARATYSMVLPEGWELAANQDILQVFTPDGVPSDKAPTCIMVIREDRVFSLDERSSYQDIVMQQYPNAIVRKSYESKVGLYDTYGVYLAVKRADGVDMVFLNYIIYTPDCTFMIMGVQHAELTEELFETTVKTFQYHSRAKSS